jgi:hypothetical protein
VIASGSSALEIHKGSHDLSRRAIIHTLHGLSFREFLEMRLNIDLPVVSIHEIIERHEHISEEIIGAVEAVDKKIIALFKEYLRQGYYPYYNEFNDESLFYITLEQNVHTTLESDLISTHPNLNGASIRKIRDLLTFIAGSVPFVPDLNKLKNIIGIGDVRTLKSYIYLLNDAGLIRLLTQNVKGMGRLEKPEKIYLNNCNQVFAIAPRGKENIGNLRETFFLSMLSPEYSVKPSKPADFIVEDTLTFEVGGKNKDLKQIKNVPDSYLAVDNIENGSGRKIPLWLFGFLY